MNFSQILFLLIILLPVVDQDTNQQIDCPGLINGTVGQNVTLQCTLEKFSLEKLVVNWTSKNESSGLPIQVHMYRNEGNDEDSQYSYYKNRTSVFPEQFKHGNISLELANVTKKDEGTYTWTVRNKDGLVNSGNITLHVVKNGSQGKWTGDGGDGGSYHLAGSDEPIKAHVGSDVVLPCCVKPPVDVRNTSVKWIFNSSDTVHLFLSGTDDLKNQDKRYSGRTFLNHTMLEHGNVSLNLTNVTKKDEGIYTCIFHRLPGHDKPEERNVTLVVGLDAGRVGGIVGGIVGLLLGALIIYCVVRRRKGKQNRRRNGNSGDEDVEIPLRD